MDFWHIVTLVGGLAGGSILQAITSAMLHRELQKVSLAAIDDYHRQIVSLKTEIARLQKLV